MPIEDLQRVFRRYDLKLSPHSDESWELSVEEYETDEANNWELDIKLMGEIEISDFTLQLSATQINDTFDIQVEDLHVL